MDKASSTLNRYLHYFSRFDNHAKAVKFAEKTLVQTEVRMRELQDLKGVGFMDVQFLLNAVTTVISCRHVLQWTYAYGFYLKDSPSKALFETYQEQLEKFCEHLHELAEKPLAELQQIRLRTDVINYTRVTEKYRDNIVRAIENNFQDS
jgi:ariadne-1